MAAPTGYTREVEREEVPIEEQIRRRAHEIYVERGESPGSDVEDWLQAEREILGDRRERDDADLR